MEGELIEVVFLPWCVYHFDYCVTYHSFIRVEWQCLTHSSLLESSSSVWLHVGVILGSKGREVRYHRDTRDQFYLDVQLYWCLLCDSATFKSTSAQLCWSNHTVEYPNQKWTKSSVIIGHPCRHYARSISAQKQIPIKPGPCSEA